MSDRDTKATATIMSFTGFAIAGAVVPIPVADMVVISGVQVSMILTLGTIYGKPINRHTAKSLTSVVFAATAGIFLASLAKTIPGVGTVAGGIMQAAIAGTITYSLGLAIKYMFDHDIELTPENFKPFFKDQLKNKDKIKKQLKEKIARVNRVKPIINFRAEPPEFTSRTSLKFNVIDYSDVTLQIKDTHHNTILETEIQNSQTEYSVDGNSMKKGKYIAFLNCDDLLPIGLYVRKG